MFDKKPTSELSPVEGTSQGKYIWFVLENLMDDKKACEIFVHQDFGYSAMISLITRRIDSYISENSFYENDERAQVIEKVIGDCNTVAPREWHGGIIVRALDAVYQYQMLGYSGDMIRNLTGKERPFDFPELEILTPLKRVMDYHIRYDYIDEFLKDRDVAAFCKQRNDLARPDKTLRNGPTDIVKYVFMEDIKRGDHLFVKRDEDGEEYMPALFVAIIARTYIDLSDEKFLVDIKKKNGWDHDVAFKNALASESGESKSKIASDLAYRLFVVAFHSEYLNVTIGHGYWPALFRPIYLRNYILVQKCVFCAFSGENPNEWRDRLRYFINNLPLFPTQDEE